jgi:alpha-glucosidase
MGAVGFKIDFMDRSDQQMVNFYERAAAEAAKYKLLIELHGAYKPSGLEYKYPNVLSYEGVLGFEQHHRCNPDNSLYLPFLRNVTGPMSTTPGSLYNIQPEQRGRKFTPHWGMIGTRAHHMAYFILFESGLQMIADAPQVFDRFPECRDFMYAAPVTWHETRALAAEVGQYAISARRHGNNWWIGGIANSAQTTRDFDLALDFLPKGQTYTLTAFVDGPEAGGENAMDYKVIKQTVKRGDKIRATLVRNGGYAATLEPAPPATK